MCLLVSLVKGRIYGTAEKKVTRGVGKSRELDSVEGGVRTRTRKHVSHNGRCFQKRGAAPKDIEATFCKLLFICQELLNFDACNYHRGFNRIKRVNEIPDATFLLCRKGVEGVLVVC